jgi:hypothetical protein
MTLSLLNKEIFRDAEVELDTELQIALKETIDETLKSEPLSDFLK